MEEQTKLTNRLWSLRRRRGLEQKQVAYLLDHQTTDQISRFERGKHSPNLKNACKLAIIYGVSIEELLAAFVADVRTEINQRAERLASIISPGATANSPTKNDADQKAGLPFDDDHADAWRAEAALDAPLCHFARLLEKPVVERSELDAARRHAIKITRTIASL